MKNNGFISIFIVICLQLLVKVSVFAEEEFVRFEDYPIEPCGTVRFQDSFEGVEWTYFRVNPANPDEAIIFDPINEDIFLEIPSYYDGDNFETPRVVTYDGKELIPTIIDNSVAGNVFGYENIKITSNIRHISRYAFMGADAKNIILEEGVVYIDDSCFWNFKGISELSLPNSLYRIGNTSFTDAENLEKILFGKGLYEVGDYSFSNNTNLTEVELPENLHILGKGAFDNCTNLKKVTIPRWIKQCSYNFNNCPNIELIDLYCESDVAVFTNSFQNVDKEKCVVMVPKGTSAWFKKWSSTFSQFKNIIERDDEGNTTVVETLESAPETDVESSLKSSGNDTEEVYSLSGVKYGSAENVPSNEIYIVTNRAGSSQKKVKH